MLLKYMKDAALLPVTPQPRLQALADGFFEFLTLRHYSSLRLLSFEAGRHIIATMWRTNILSKAETLDGPSLLNKSTIKPPKSHTLT